MIGNLLLLLSALLPFEPPGPRLPAGLLPLMEQSAPPLHRAPAPCLGCLVDCDETGPFQEDLPPGTFVAGINLPGGGSMTISGEWLNGYCYGQSPNGCESMPCGIGINLLVVVTGTPANATYPMFWNTTQLTQAPSGWSQCVLPHTFSDPNTGKAYCQINCGVLPGRLTVFDAAMVKSEIFTFTCSPCQ